MSEVVELREVTDRRDVVHRGVQCLATGDSAVLPSETRPVFVASALNCRRLPRPVDPADPHALLLRGADELGDFVPGVSHLAGRIGRRCWPGPLMLKIAADAEFGFLNALPETARQSVLQQGRLAVRVSSHPVLSEVAKLTRGPLIVRELTADPASKKFNPSAITDAEFIVFEGTHPGTPATIVNVNGASWQAERIGVLTEQRLQLVACEILLFVCTGNTCRSPMAEALCRQMLAERLKCQPQDLTQRGFVVASAGLSADYGGPPSAEAVNVLRKRGVDLRSHASQPLTDRLIEQADRCWTMTRQHRNAILDSHPELADRVQLLCEDGTDISDPIGAGPAEYAACAAAIERHLTRILDKVV